MSCTKTFFAGVFCAFALGWWGLVIVPYNELGQLKPEVDKDTGDAAPMQPSGLAAQGRKVYAANGCVYCHSQQVRSADEGSDIARNWGVRRTVARDYIYEKPALLGSQRIGPDLSNIGKRQPSVEVYYKHLYNPDRIVTGSTMPPYRFLFSNRKIVGQPSNEALKLDGKDAPAPGYEVVPTSDAKALVAYLLSLDKSYALPEAPTK
jgi:cytochrome c oxidase cbb3-type subunit 2